MYCEICQIEYATKKTFKKHFFRKHKKSIVICKLCDMIFCSTREKTLHRINYHKFIFKCNNCERTFKEKKGLNRHVKQKHDDLQRNNANNVSSSNYIRPSKSTRIFNPLALSSKSEEATSLALVEKPKRGSIILRLKSTNKCYSFLKHINIFLS